MQDEQEANVRLFRGRTLDGRWIVGGIARAYLNHRAPEEEDDQEPEYVITYKARNYVVEQYTIGESTGLYDLNDQPLFLDDLVEAKWNEETIHGVIRFGLHVANMTQERVSYGFYIEWANQEFLRKELGFWADRIVCRGPWADNAQLWVEWKKGNGA